MDKQKPSQKLIFFLFDDRDVDLSLKKYGPEALKTSKCFAFTASAYQKLAGLKIGARECSSYFKTSRGEELNELASMWAQNWYRKCGLDIKLADFNLLSILELSLHNYFAKKVFQLVSIEEIIKRERPSVVVIGSEESGLKKIFSSNFECTVPIIKLVAEKNGIETKLLRPAMDFLVNRSSIKLFVSSIVSTTLKYPKKNFGKFDYIFLGHHYHIKNIFPVLLKLKKDGKKTLVVGRLDSTRSLLSIQSIDYLNIEEKTGISLNNPLKKTRLFLYTLGLNKESLRSYFELDGFYLWNVFKPKITSVIGDCLKVWSYSKIASDLIKETAPKVVINVSGDSSIQSFTAVARNKKVPSLEIEHGFTVGSDSRNIDADKLAVWGKIPRIIYKNTGFDDRKIEITGWPAFEIYKNPLRGTKRSSALPACLKKTVVITFLAQDPEGASLLFSQNTPEKNLDLFFEAISGLHKKVEVVVRLHPRADKAMLYLIARKYNVKFKFSENDESLSELLANSDIVVGQTTSATLDAVIMHKPVIYLPSMKWPAKFVEGSGAVFEVSSAEEILEKINYILKNGLNKKIIGTQTKFINEYCNFSENSIENLANLINGLAYEQI